MAPSKPFLKACRHWFPTCMEDSQIAFEMRVRPGLSRLTPRCGWDACRGIRIPAQTNDAQWDVPEVPAELRKPGIEISGPASITPMFINALNPGPEGRTRGRLSGR